MPVPYYIFDGEPYYCDITGEQFFPHTPLTAYLCGFGEPVEVDPFEQCEDALEFVRRRYGLHEPGQVAAVFAVMAGGQEAYAKLGDYLARTDEGVSRDEVNTLDLVLDMGGNVEEDNHDVVISIKQNDELVQMAYPDDRLGTGFYRAQKKLVQSKPAYAKTKFYCKPIRDEKPAAELKEKLGKKYPDQVNNLYSDDATYRRLGYAMVKRKLDLDLLKCTKTVAVSGRYKRYFGVQVVDIKDFRKGTGQVIQDCAIMAQLAAALGVKQLKDGNWGEDEPVGMPSVLLDYEELDLAPGRAFDLHNKWSQTILPTRKAIKWARSKGHPMAKKPKVGVKKNTDLPRTIAEASPSPPPPPSERQALSGARRFMNNKAPPPESVSDSGSEDGDLGPITLDQWSEVANDQSKKKQLWPSQGWKVKFGSAVNSTVKDINKIALYHFDGRLPFEEGAELMDAMATILGIKGYDARVMLLRAAGQYDAEEDDGILYLVPTEKSMIEPSDAVKGSVESAYKRATRH